MLSACLRLFVCLFVWLSVCFSKVYAWALLRNVFSEVLPREDWLVLWDHILTEWRTLPLNGRDMVYDDDDDDDVVRHLGGGKGEKKNRRRLHMKKKEKRKKKECSARVSSGPELLLYAVVSYLCCSRSALLQADDRDSIVAHFHRQDSQVDIKVCLSVCLSGPINQSMRSRVMKA